MLDKAKELCQNITVLVVEDEQTLRDIIVESMEPYVKEIHVASNGVEGLDAFKNNPIDLIISDIHMAKMNGLRMSHEIRKFDPNVPIIFLTAYDTDDNMLEAIEVKSRSVLRKPFDKRQLLLSMTLAVSNFREEFKAYQLAHDFVYHIESRELCKKNEVISLTKKERRLLELMLKHHNHVVPFSLIENYVWADQGATPDAIRMFINKLRKKTYPELIENLQGIGYKLSLDS